MPVNDNIINTIGLIYDTVLNVDVWPDALENIAACTGASASVFMVSDPVLAELEMMQVDRSNSMGRPSSYLSQRVAGAEKEWIHFAANTPAQEIFSDLDVWPDRHVYDQMPSVAWLKGGGLYHRNAARLCEHGGWLDAIAVLYAADRAGMNEAEQESLQCFLPHLARTVEIRRPFTLLENRYQAVLSVLDRLGIGVSILSRDGNQILQNGEAARIFSDADGIALTRDKKISVRDDAARQDLAGAISEAAKTARDEGQDNGRSVVIKRTSGEDPYILDVSPIRIDNSEYDEFVYGVLIFLVDPSHRAMISTTGMSKAFDLTPAEAEICQLISEGLSNQEIADHQRVSFETAKTHSSAVLNKTGVRNRAELVRRALTIVPPIIDSNGKREN